MKIEIDMFVDECPFCHYECGVNHCYLKEGGCIYEDCPLLEEDVTVIYKDKPNEPK